jgi:hypothetical protein
MSDGNFETLDHYALIEEHDSNYDLTEDQEKPKKNGKNPIQSIILTGGVIGAVAGAVGYDHKPAYANTYNNPGYQINFDAEESTYNPDYGFSPEIVPDEVDEFISDTFEDYLLSLSESEQKAQLKYEAKATTLLRKIYDDVYTDRSFEEFKSVELTKLISFMISDQKKLEESMNIEYQDEKRWRPFGYAGAARTTMRLRGTTDLKGRPAGSQVLGYEFNDTEWNVINQALQQANTGDDFFGYLSSNYYDGKFGGDNSFLFVDRSAINRIPAKDTVATYNFNTIAGLSGKDSDEVTKVEDADKASKKAIKFNPKHNFAKYKKER